MEFMPLAVEKFRFPLPVYFIVAAIAALVHHNLRGVAISDSVQGVIERTLLYILTALVLNCIESYL